MWQIHIFYEQLLSSFNDNITLTYFIELGLAGFVSSIRLLFYRNCLRFDKHEVEFSCISEYSYKLMWLLYAAVVQEALTRREKDSKRKNTERREGPLASAVLTGHWTIKLGNINSWLQQKLPKFGFPTHRTSAKFDCAVTRLQNFSLSRTLVKLAYCFSY